MSAHPLRARAFRAAALSLVLAAAGMSSSSALAAQAPAVRDLPKPVREIEDPYTLIAAVKEGPRGTLIVSDAGDGELSTVTLATGERAPLGRQGSGPGEYRAPANIFKLRGDTIWVLDAPQQRLVAYQPDLKAGVPIQMMMFDTQSRTALMAPFHADDAGRMYSGTMSITGPQIDIPDSVDIVRFDARSPTARNVLGKVRFPTSGKPQMQMDGPNMKYTMAFPGLVTADSWAVFPDGRVAIVHGHNYTVEFIGADGKRTTGKPIAYDRTPVTKADQDAEMAEAKKQLAEQMKAVTRNMPAGVKLDINMTPPETWPSTYPAITPMAIHAAPDGMLWVRRSTPVKADREHWDVIDASGALVARWRVPARTRLVGVGAGAVYTVRLDEDELQYLQRVEVRGR